MATTKRSLKNLIIGQQAIPLADNNELAVES
jgi:hypothetical protein